MNAKRFLVFSAGLVSALFAMADVASPAAARVNVTFVNPDKFTDVKEEVLNTERAREYYLGLLEKHILSTAPRYLTRGERLEIRITNVDLAGDFEPWHGINFSHIRILKDIYPPRMDLEFRLMDAGGNVISSGKRRLLELGYLMTTSLSPTDNLRYDKDMITDWLRQEFRRPS
jgi:hypothetical protein